MIILQILFYPFAMLYNLVTGIRNRMYDLGLRPSIKFDVPVVAVGNLTVGGTGKTPLTEYLIRLLAMDYKVATLSRGYGRKTKGFRMADSSDNADTIGDEPFQMYQKFGSSTSVAVGEDRAFAIPNILQAHPETDVILMDDAYQHRSVSPYLNILLSDYHRPFYEDHLLPAGRLRESRNSANRADVVVVTKCPSTLTDEAMIAIEKSIRVYVEKPVFFSRIRYRHPLAFPDHQKKISHEVVLLTGISNPKPLVLFVKQNFKLVKHFNFPDHHRYTISDLKAIVRYAEENPTVSILTTEKDKVKLAVSQFNQLRSQLSLFYLPIELEFIKSGGNFDAIVLNSLRRAG
ncbi:MAG: tetraacyldisaccharide 4'-kinase [Cyclobacteriaceae bacterium]|nr:tetraacyldisaccharide 4'-kinase [Cyclobacteriaceae bacterium]